MRTITALFDSRAEAETARSRLAAAGISNDNVSIHDKTSLGDRDSRETAGARSGVVYGSDTRTANDHAVANPGLSQAKGDADGRDGTHRNAIGDHVDNRTGDLLTGETGSDRTALGDYVDTGDLRSEKRVDRHDNGEPGVWDRIKAFFTGDDHIYEEGLRRGGYLVTARVEDHDAERAIDILDDEGTVNLDERQAVWSSEGWQRGADNADRTRGSRVRSYDWDNQRS